MGAGADTIKRIACEKTVFRERDVAARDVSPSCLEDARTFRYVVPHGRGVWSHINYTPTRYELVQIRLKSIVFWGPSALWLLGVTQREPDALWIVIGNKAKPPRTLPFDSVLIRSRHLEEGVLTLQDPYGLLELRVHSRERAEADVARCDLPGLLDRSLRPKRFFLEPGAELLSAHVRPSRLDWSPLPPPPQGFEEKESWAVARRFPLRPPRRIGR